VLTQSRYLEGLESRLTALERSLAGVSGRVSRIESLEVDESLPQQQSPDTIHSIELQNHDGTTEGTYDPTDGIGSISFTKEEESAYFGTICFNAQKNFWLI
jgi:hypothetical protein